jgi:hypothetical protein
MNPTQLLRKDHSNVKALFQRFEKADRNSERQKLGQEIIEELSLHAVVEEQLIYPLLRERDARTEDRVLNALEEHHAVKLILAELDELSSDHERYRAKVHVVREAVEMHIEEEEAKLLPRLDAMLDADERRRLAEGILAMKAVAPNHPHPGAPDTPPGLGITGLIAKVADTGLDVVRRLTSADQAAGHRSVQRRVRAAERKLSRSRSKPSRPKRRRRSAGGATAKKTKKRASRGARRR